MSRLLRHSWRTAALFVALLALALTGLAWMPVRAQETPTPGAAPVQPAVQEIAGFLQTDEAKVYRLADIRAGQTIAVYLENQGGNLDPFLALFPGDADMQAVATQFQQGVQAALDAGAGPVVAVMQVADQVALAWNDDTPPAHTAALSFTAPADGDYLLLVRSALVETSFGKFRLLLGLDAPDVLTGAAQPTGAVIGEIDRTATPRQVGIEVVTGTVTVEDPTTLVYLQPLEAGDTLYARIDATAGDLRPIMMLHDYSGKVLRVANPGGATSSGSFSYTVPADVEGYFLDFVACCPPEQLTSGDARLTVGRNAPEALEGAATDSSGVAVLRRATPVNVGIRLQQITGVDQKAENFGAQFTIRMEWTDPDLAFDPDECMCAFKTYNGDSFRDFVNSRGRRWPDFTLYNQQNNRWSQNKVVVVYPNGRAIYLERATTTLQAPDFDFRTFPFDVQDFYIRLDMIYPQEYFVVRDDAAFTAVGDQLGEEEWYITEWDTQISAERLSSINTVARYSFHFESQRHLSYYVIRFFVPLALILLVSWITLFLSNYMRRIEATSANLLLFIAWNFAVGSDLPRLGYLTFMDVLLLTTFVLNVSIIVYNVMMYRLEATGRGERAQRIDRFALWLYPLSFFALLLVLYVLRQLFG